MSHAITNVEGFEIINGQVYFASDQFVAGGAVGTVNAFASRPPWVVSHNTALLTAFQGWGRIPAAYTTTGVPFTWPLTHRSAIVRVYYRPSAPAPFAATTIIGLWSSGPTGMETRVEIDNLLELSVDGVKGPFPTPLVLDTWNLLEYAYDSTTGARELRLGGVPEYVGSVLAGQFDAVQFGEERATGTGLHFFDDAMVLADRANPVPVTDFPGAGEVHRLYATGVGSIDEWNLGAGANKTAAVNDNAPDGDGSYIINPGVPNRHQVFTYDPISPMLAAFPGSVVKALKFGTISRRDTGSPAWHHVNVISGATNDETITEVWAGAAYAQRGSKVYHDDPDTGLAWTAAAVDAVEAGLGIHNNRLGRCTNCYLQVDIGDPFPAMPGRAKLNPLTLGPAGAAMLGARPLGG